MSSRDQYSPDTDRLGEATTAKEVVNTLPDLIFEFDTGGHYIALHAGDESDLYCSPSEFLGKHFRDVLPEVVSQQFGGNLEQALTEGVSTRVNYLLPDDEVMQYFECRFLPMTNGHVLGLIRNMTDSWRSKTELEQSETQYRTLVNNIPGMVYRCHTDEAWTAVYVSPAVEDLSGYHATEFMTQQRTLADLIHPEDRARVRREVLGALEQRRPFHVSYRLVDSEGEIHHVAERGQAVYAEYDEVEYLDGVVFDISDIHRMRQRLLLNSKMAAVGNLAAGVAHEINNPLTIAMANLEFVADALIVHSDGPQDGDESPAEEVQVAIEKVQQGINRVRTIIDDLRSFTDAADSRADQIDLKRLTEWAVRRTQSRTSASRADRIDVDLDDVPPIWASEVGIVQVIWNLLDNGLEAIERHGDANHQGSVQIALKERDETVVLEVCDDGPGMSDEVAQRAFEPFFTTKTVGQGAGLGLFVCKGLVEGMDGTIEVETKPGHGTCVSVALPSFQPHYGDPGDN